MKKLITAITTFAMMFSTTMFFSAGDVGKADAVKIGFRKWQEFTVLEDALMNCF